MPHEGEEKLTYMRTYYIKNRERLITNVHKYRKLMKRSVIKHYGGKCACCGEDILKFLAIDHIEGNGNKHRREINLKSGSSFYTWLKRNGFPEGFQILCHNCNVGRQWNGGICPHNDNPKETV